VGGYRRRAGQPIYSLQRAPAKAASKAKGGSSLRSMRKEERTAEKRKKGAARYQKFAVRDGTAAKDIL